MKAFNSNVLGFVSLRGVLDPIDIWALCRTWFVVGLGAAFIVPSRSAVEIFRYYRRR